MEHLLGELLAYLRLDAPHELSVRPTALRSLADGLTDLRIAEVEARLEALTGLDVGSWQPDPLP